MEGYIQSVEKQSKIVLAELPKRVEALEKTIKALKLEKSASVQLEEFKKAFDCVAPTKPNERVQNAMLTVTSELNYAIEITQQLAHWVQLLVPKIADGNNFGVEVQKSVHAHLRESINNFQKAWDALPEYANQRALAIEKIKGKDTEERTKTSTLSNSEGKKDGSENIKESTSITKEIHISGDQVPDWIAYIATLDLKWYYNYLRILDGIRCHYALTLDVTKKNMDKILLPRGVEASNYREKTVMVSLQRNVSKMALNLKYHCNEMKDFAGWALPGTMLLGWLAWPGLTPAFKEEVFGIKAIPAPGTEPASSQSNVFRGSGKYRYVREAIGEPPILVEE